MSRKQLLIRITDEDRESLALIADSIGGVSYTAAIRFMIRQWRNKISHFDIQVTKPSSRV